MTSSSKLPGWKILEPSKLLHSLESKWQAMGDATMETVIQVGVVCTSGSTPWKINMEPENDGLVDDFPFQLGDF